MVTIIQKTRSICPECQEIIDADYIEEDGQAFMVKECKDHGKFKDLVSINAKHFRWIQQFTFNSEAKMCNPQTQTDKGCPLDCGICDFHKSAPAMAITDVTYRCNLKCPVCFANALTETGKNIEPSFEELRRIYTHFRQIKPQPPVCAFFSGGEPTVREDFPKILRMAKDLGYAQLQVATNGIRFAKDINYLEECIDAGLNAMYLQFDGVNAEVYKKIRGADIWHIKQKVIENCRKLKYHDVILTPTIVKGVNDDQVTKIFDYAIKNIDVVSVVSYQPIALCGRFDQEKLLEQRYTSSHVMDALNKHTNGLIPWMYPMIALARFAKVGAWLSNSAETLELTCHSICGYGSFVSYDPNTKQIYDMSSLFNIPKFLRITEKWYDRLLKKQKKKKYKDVFNFGPISRGLGALLDRGDVSLDKARFAADLLTTMRNPLTTGVSMSNYIQRARLFIETMINSSRESSADYLTKGNNLLVALMHFQDGYNLDVERTSRCLVHYGYIDPKSNLIRAVPFCPMNAIHRPRIEKELLMAQAVSKEEEEDEVPIPQLHS
ncbi:MAG: radical SAM protein [Candidatus Helarchaeota archaeon]|nr:radical SAM protein [Candidatus Helarchaeota archaeon]